jgi:hypothetical protein
VALDLSALQAAAGAANTFVETYQDLLARHQQAVRDLVAARRHNEELHARGRPDWDTVRDFVNFAQHRCDVAQGRPRQAIQHEADATQDNEKLRAELQSFGDLRTRHTVAEEVAEEAYTRRQDYAIGLENRLAHRADPSVPFAALPSTAQDLQDAHDENKHLKHRLHDESARLGQQITDLGHRLQAAYSDRDVALQDLFRLQKDRTDIRHHYNQLKSYGEERDREIRQLRKDLAETVPAADLQASRLEAHVRGQRIVELEKLLSKSESRRHKLHDVHDHVVDKLKRTEQEIPDLKRQLYSYFRQHAHAEVSLQGIENKLRALQIEHSKLVKAKLAVDEELKTLNRLKAPKTGCSRSKRTTPNWPRPNLPSTKNSRRSDRDSRQSRTTAKRSRRTVSGLTRVGNFSSKSDASSGFACRRPRPRLLMSPGSVRFAMLRRLKSAGSRSNWLEPMKTEITRSSDATKLSWSLSQVSLRRSLTCSGRTNSYRDQLQDRYDGLQKEHQDLSTDRDSAIRERASALDRLTSLASAALREASTTRRERSVSSTRRSTKRSLSPSPASRPSDSGRSRKIFRSSSSLSSAEGGDHRSGPSEIGSDARSVDLDPAPDQQGQLQGSPARSAAASVGSVGGHDPAKPTASDGSDVASGNSDASSGGSDDDQVRVALARSRVDARRRKSSDQVPSSRGSATAPFELGPEVVEGETGEDSGEAEVEDLTASNRAGPIFQPYGSTGSFVPGLHQPRHVVEGDVAPWDPDKISALTLDTVTPRILIDCKVLKARWLFPKRLGHVGQLDPALYIPGLITEANVTALYDG